LRDWQERYNSTFAGSQGQGCNADDNDDDATDHNVSDDGDGTTGDDLDHDDGDNATGDNVDRSRRR
jgi:hypothetical protein